MNEFSPADVSEVKRDDLGKAPPVFFVTAGQDDVGVVVILVPDPSEGRMDRRLRLETRASILLLMNAEAAGKTMDW